MNKLTPLALACALAATGFAGNCAFAQREAPTRADKRAERQQINENLTPEEQQAARAARWQARLNSMTPEQRTRFEARRAEMQQKMKDAGIDPNDPNAWQKAREAGIMGNRGGGNNRAAEDAMRQMMIAAGITEKEVQDAVIAYVGEQNRARAGLFQLAQTAAQALQTPLVLPIDQGEVDKEAVNAKVATTFDAYQTAAAAEKARETQALADLDAKINYSTTPRLKSFLTLVGILDNEVLALGGPAALFAAPQNDANGGAPRQASAPGQAPAGDANQG